MTLKVWLQSIPRARSVCLLVLGLGLVFFAAMHNVDLAVNYFVSRLGEANILYEGEDCNFFRCTSFVESYKLGMLLLLASFILSMVYLVTFAFRKVEEKSG